MTIVLRITVAALCILFAFYAIRLIGSGKLLLKYALLWFVLIVIALFCAIFPNPVFSLAYALGFNAASNFILFIGLLFAFAISLSLTVALSRLSYDVTTLVQENAILRSQLKQRVSLQDGYNTPKESE